MIKSRRLRWAGHVARIEEGKSASKMLTGKLVRKRPLGRPRRIWEDNIRMDLSFNFELFSVMICFNGLGLCIFRCLWEFLFYSFVLSSFWHFY